MQKAQPFASPKTHRKLKPPYNENWKEEHANLTRLCLELGYDLLNLFPNAARNKSDHCIAALENYLQDAGRSSSGRCSYGKDDSSGLPIAAELLNSSIWI